MIFRPLNHVVRDHVLGTLRACDGNKARAARNLSIGKRTIDLVLIRWGINRAWKQKPGRKRKL